MSYNEKQFDEKQNVTDNIFANVIRIGGNILSTADDAIVRIGTPQWAKASILKYIKEIEQKLEGIKE